MQNVVDMAAEFLVDIRGNNYGDINIRIVFDTLIDNAGIASARPAVTPAPSAAPPPVDGGGGSANAAGGSAAAVVAQAASGGSRSPAQNRRHVRRRGH